MSIKVFCVAKKEEERVGIGLSEMRQSTKSESVEIGSNLQYIIGE